MDRAYVVYKLMCFLLYEDRPDIMQWSGVVCKLKLGPLSRLLGTTNYRLKDYLARAEQCGYISGLNASYGFCTFTLRMPPSVVRAVMDNRGANVSS